MMQVLEKNNLNHVLCIVIRYFGKIKLGAGGLVRAYTKSVTETIKNNIITLIKGYKIKLTFSYEFIKTIDYLLKDKNILKKYFDEKITYIVEIPNNTLEDIKSINNIDIEILDNIYIIPNN